MKELEKLLAIQQEYEYFTRHCKTESDYAKLHEKSIFQSDYMIKIMDSCNKYVAANKLREKKLNLSKIVFIAILIFYSVLVIFAITQF